MTTTNCHQNSEPFKLLELYSGIGGMHFAIKELSVECNVVTAIDINTTANEVYKHNFPDTPVMQRNLLSLTANEVDELKPSIITMSPPCQPFTRLGLKNDCKDPRTSSFLSVLQVIASLRNRPMYILLENVKGFEESDARKEFINTLCDCGYVYQEFLLNPLHFGIPNSRLRYYLIGKLKPLKFCFPPTDEVLESLPSFKSDGCKSHSVTHPINIEPQGTLSSYLEKLTPEEENNFLLSHQVLHKYGMILDIVDKSMDHSCCFTKGYGHYVQGTGSVLHSNLDVQVMDAYNLFQQVQIDQDKVAALKPLRLRYFTPREIANLMHFPKDFSFPDTLSQRQRYKLLGNSVNVKMVALVMSYMFPNPCGTSCGCNK